MATPDDPDQLSRPGVPRAGGGPRAPAANPAPLRWATGVFLTYIGARGLIVPQVSNQGAIDGLALLAPTVEGFLIVQALLRVAILLAGVGLIFVAARPHHRRFALVAQAAAFIVLAWWSVVLLVSSAVAAASYFGALALGIGLSAFVERERGRAWGRGRHPFSLVMILAALPVGVLMLLPLGPYQAPVYRPVADQLPWVGAGFLVGCACLLVAELQRQALNAWSVIGRVLLAVAWIAWIVTFLAPFGLFNLVPLYGGFSLLLLLEPVVGPHLPRLDATTLRARTSVALVAAIAVPSFLGMGVVSNFEEYVDRRAELEREQAQASAVAATLGLRLARMAGLASVLANQPAAAASIPLEVYSSQSFLGATILNPDGQALRMVGLPATFAVSEAPRWTPGPRGSSIGVVDAGGGQLLVLVAQPMAGNVAVVVATADEMQAWITPVMAIADAHVSVVERTGGVLLELGARPRLIGVTEADGEAPRAYLRGGGPTPAALAYTPGGEALAGIASVPETTWGVVSERSATAALAAGRSGPELTFIVLVVVLGLAAIVGLITAQALTRPLERLAAAIRQVARDGSGTALPRSSIRDIASLAADFEAMQRQLARREAEERAARAEAESARQAAEDALRLRDVFLRTLAHDLKAPLASLTWHIQLLQRRVREGRLDPPSLEDGLQAIGLGATEAEAAIDELHDLTRLEAGVPLPLHREPIDLAAFVEQLVGARGATAPEQIRVEVRAAGLLVDGDRARLARVLNNLFDNALKYSRAGGEVRVCVDREQDERADWAVVRVQDSGVGIPASDLPRVFERYTRGSNAAQIPGEGLGLASVRQLVQVHGGRVEVESVEGVGTTVTVRLALERVGLLACSEVGSQTQAPAAQNG